jgi:L-2,4-diaminobutyrate decarboxylase
MTDGSFLANAEGLRQAADALLNPRPSEAALTLPSALPETGLGESEALERLAPIVIGQARRLGAPEAFAHMDPPTPWIAWAATLWTAALNQNLLHPDVAPVARDLEVRVVDWLAPLFGMDGGHMVPGSTIANLTALWAAREVAGAEIVITSEAAHLSVGKSAHILGMECVKLPLDARGGLAADALPKDLSKAVLVLTAGTTSAGVIEDLSLAGRAAWTHVDAAWAGPLRLSPRYAGRLDGVEQADSVAVSAHKWLFQPKESGLILFRDSAAAQQAISFGGAYLAVPNVGVLGSHGAIAVPLLATLLAWGRAGMAERIERCMAAAEDLWEFLSGHPGVEVFEPQDSGVVLWRPRGAESVDPVFQRLAPGLASKTQVAGWDWIRQVAANPNADVKTVSASIGLALAAGRGDAGQEGT